MNTKDLFKIETCYLKDNNKKFSKKGKVIAVSIYIDKRRVCFLIEGEKRGRWFSEEEITEKTPDQEVIEKEFIKTINFGKNVNLHKSSGKVKSNFRLEKKIGDYLEEAILEQPNIEATLVEAVHVEEQLAAI
jgi:hypothetical protein